MNVSASINLPSGMTVEQLKKALVSVPDEAKVSVSVIQADRFGSDTGKINFTWTIE